MVEKITEQNPSERIVAEIVQKIYNESAVSIKRFSVGACNFVYDVVTQSNRQFVVRIAAKENKRLAESSIYWYQLLKPKGVRLPELLYYDTESITAPFPYLIIERLKGEDLGIVYPQLTTREKKVLAKQISKIQDIAGSLPLAKGFGFVQSYEDNAFHKTWTNVLHNSLNRSADRIKQIGVVNVQHIERVRKEIEKYESYFSQVMPKCFLDDMTTKNVIIDDGKLSGIVDLDCVCFGDNLFPIALTRMSLLNTGFDLDYINYWCEEARITDEQQEVLNIYTALFCVDFMGELGQTFNKERAELVQPEDVEGLSEILDKLLKNNV